MAAIPRHVLLACEPFGPRLGADAVAAALTRGLREAASPPPDVVPLARSRADERPGGQLDAVDFDGRMRAARAVVLAAAELRERTLAGSIAFEIATRARQSGVPCYAVTAEDELDSFDARILDLQLVLEARSTRALTAAGRRLAGII